MEHAIMVSETVKLKQQMAQNKMYLDITDVTLLTGYSSATIRRRITEGKLECVQSCKNGKILFKKDMIDSWLNGYRKKPL